MRPRPAPHHRRRTGLTLIELLVVILIIGLLMALLLPAVGGAMSRAKQARVTSEINNLATALADFKNRFGDYPPSRLYCSETGNYSIPSGADADTKQLIQRSIKYIRKFWPRVQLNTGGDVDFTKIPGAGVRYDFNGNQTTDSAYILQGPECLVFFLGGLPTLANGQYSMTGFDRNPLNPFQPSREVEDTTTKKVTTKSSNRIPPFYEFNSARLDDTEAGTVNGVPCYLDPLGTPDSQPMGVNNDKRPYAYFSSYGSSSYDPNDYNASYEIDGSTPPVVIGRQFSVAFQSGLLGSAGPNPYTSSGPVVYATGSTTLFTSASFQNPETFQIISSGIDRQWGIGGQFLANASPHIPFDSGSSGPFYDKGTYVTPGDTGNPRSRESDNLTNFSGGRMD